MRPYFSNHCHFLIRSFVTNCLSPHDRTGTVDSVPGRGMLARMTSGLLIYVTSSAPSARRRGEGRSRKEGSETTPRRSIASIVQKGSLQGIIIVEIYLPCFCAGKGLPSSFLAPSFCRFPSGYAMIDSDTVPEGNYRNPGLLPRSAF